MSLLVIYQALGLFVNTLTAHDKNSLGSTENLLQRLSNAIISKIKNFF